MFSKKAEKKCSTLEKTILQVLILHNIPNKKLVISSWKLKVTVKKRDKRLYNVKKCEIKVDNFSVCKVKLNSRVERKVNMRSIVCN